MKINKSIVLCVILGLSAVTSIVASFAQEPIATLRNETRLNAEGSAPAMTPFDESSGRKTRNYPEQPPVIPHDIEGYQVNLNANKCLSCHARSRTTESGAPMISITHFMDRDGQFRAAVTPRRYFCTQCHVSQHNVTPPIENEFVDIDKLIRPSE